MHVLMIGQMTGKDFQHLLQEENVFIAPLEAEGLVRDIFIKADGSGPVLILADVTADQARERFAAMPFIVHDIATFDFIEMNSRPAGHTTNQ